MGYRGKISQPEIWARKEVVRLKAILTISEGWPSVPSAVVSGVGG